MLAEEELGYEDRIRFIRSIKKQLERMQWLVETLLKMSKIEAGTVTFKRERIDVGEMVKKACDPLLIPLELRDIGLEIKTNGAGLTGDIDWLAEAVGNIVKNCMEHTPEGGTITINAEENAKIANAGIIIVGKGDKVRALMAYGGGPNGCVGYAQAANKYKEVFPDVNVYCMVIPTAVEFYCPDKAKSRTHRQLPTIRNVIAHLDPGVKPVDVYTTLGKHADEDIFLRTDHHWSPLGGYYAAEEFARVAGVPFKDLSHYERRVTHGYVGSMYGYSKDIAIKNAPEDFVYYVPKGVEYTTTYTNYTINKNYQVTGEGKPFTAPLVTS